MTSFVTMYRLHVVSGFLMVTVWDVAAGGRGPRGLVSDRGSGLRKHLRGPEDAAAHHPTVTSRDRCEAPGLPRRRLDRPITDHHPYVRSVQFPQIFKRLFTWGNFCIGKCTGWSQNAVFNQTTTVYCS